MWAFVTLAIIVACILWNARREGKTPAAIIGLGLIRLYARLWHGCHFPAYADLPKKGAALLVVNHTSSPDGCFVQCGSRRGLTFLVAKEFFQPQFLWIWATTSCIPVDRESCDIRAVRDGLRRLNEGRVVVVFPEGSLSRAGLKGMRAVKCGAAYLALKTDVPVYPTFISGGPQSPHVGEGWFCPSPKRVRIVYGKPIDLSPYRGRRITRPLLEEVSRFIMGQVVALGVSRDAESSERSAKG